MKTLEGLCLDPCLSVIYQDADILVVNKPADLVCHPTKGDVYSSLISRVRLHLGDGIQPQLINRLDRETSGITLVAMNLQAARELRRSWEMREVQKTYQAIVHGHLLPESGSINAPLGPDENSVVAIKDCVRADGAAACTEYKVLNHFTKSISRDSCPADFSLLELRPHTGRKHQIRIHLAHLGYPIVGDKIYGLDPDAYLAMVEHRLTDQQRESMILPCQALHASELRFSWRGREWAFCAQPESWFTDFSSQH